MTTGTKQPTREERVKALRSVVGKPDRAHVLCQSPQLGWVWLLVNPDTVSLEQMQNIGGEGCWGSRDKAAPFVYGDAVELAAVLNADVRRRGIVCGFYVERLDGGH